MTAEYRRAPTARDLATIRAGARSSDPELQRIAVRALGRLERPALIPDIVPALKSPLPEIRVQAADAIGQAAHGWKLAPSRAAAMSLDRVVDTLVTHLKIEMDSEVRAAITETLGRLPYTTADQIQTAEATLVLTAGSETVSDRLGIAKGAEALVRLNRQAVAPSTDLITKLRSFVASDPSRDARVRRLALEALITIDAADEGVIARAAGDPDSQVRRLAVRAAAGRPSSPTARETLARASGDEAAMVRLEALRSIREEDACPASVAATADRDLHVVLLALDRLATCASSPDAVALLEHTIHDLSEAGVPRGWHRGAHALVALATAAPDRGRAALPQFVGSTLWPLRLYAARAATNLKDRATLEKLAGDENESVREVATEGLAAFGVHVTGPTPARAAAAGFDPTAEDFRDVLPARARITVHNVGTFDIALIRSEAPATVARFMRLADAGSYNGLTFRVSPNLVAEAGGSSAGTSDGQAESIREEIGLWPHVRGAVGLSAHEADSGRSQLFIDLVDNPQFDHQFTVFAQLLNGLEVVDAILEGDTIEKIEIVHGP